jgi:tetratricopeptide (TPR) repeat protein
MGVGLCGKNEPIHKAKGIIPLILLLGIFIKPTFPEYPPLRTVTVKVAADLSLKSFGNWKIPIGRSLKATDDIFKREFGIQLQIGDFVYWRPEKTHVAMRLSLSDLQSKVNPDGCDIVLGLISRNNRNIIPEGIASYLHGNILLDYSEDQFLLNRVLLHELCHVFGACDLDERGSIMDCEELGSKFDEFTWKIIQLNRSRSFHRKEFPLPKHLLNEAIDLYNKRYILNQTEPGIALSLVFLYLEKKNPHSALDICRKLLDQNPDVHEIHTILGNIYNRIGNLEAALEEYKTALELNPEVSETYFNLGLVYTQKKWLDLAISAYKKAIQLNPTYARAHSNLGNLFLLKGELDQSIQECGIALQLCQDLPEALCTMAAALIQKRNNLEQNLNLISLGENKKLLMKKTGGEFIKQAIALCEKAFTIKIDLPVAYNILGMAYVYQQKNMEAEKAFLKAIKFFPDFIEAHMNLGTMYYHNKISDKAAFHIKRILEIEPSSEVSFQILKKIFQGQHGYPGPAEAGKIQDPHKILKEKSLLLIPHL